MDVTRQCKQIGCGKKAARNQVYCSRAHAPYGNLGIDTGYVRAMERSTSKELGEESSRRSIYAPKAERDPWPVRVTHIGRTTPIKKDKPLIDETPKEVVKNPESGGTIKHLNKNYFVEESPTPKDIPTPKLGGPNGEKDMREIGKSIAAMNTLEEPEETPSTDFTQKSIALEKAKSDSMTLIDESATHLRDLMKSVKLQDNPSGVLQACNCASQIHKLIRLKFDIARSMRG